jgi:hypothetical protein
MKLFTLRDGRNRIVGTTTNGDTVARDRGGSILGRSSQTHKQGGDRSTGGWGVRLGPSWNDTRSETAVIGSRWRDRFR